MHTESTESVQSGTAGGWQVEPGQVQAFAAAAATVREDLSSVLSQVEEIADPAFSPMLGTSPVARELAEKFRDRLVGADGLLTQLDTVLRRLDEFTASAERTAAGYQDSDDSAWDSFRAR